MARVFPQEPEEILVKLEEDVGYKLLSLLPPINKFRITRTFHDHQYYRMVFQIGKRTVRHRNGTNYTEYLWAAMKMEDNVDKSAPIMFFAGSKRNIEQHTFELLTTEVRDPTTEFIDFSPLQGVRNVAELRAILKYYFVIAAHLRKFSTLNTRVPAKPTFTKLLTRVCERIRKLPRMARTDYGKPPHRVATSEAPGTARRAMLKARKSLRDGKLGEWTQINKSALPTMVSPRQDFIDLNANTTSGENGDKDVDPVPLWLGDYPPARLHGGPHYWGFPLWPGKNGKPIYKLNDVPQHGQAMLREASRFFEGQISKDDLSPNMVKFVQKRATISAKVAKKFARFAAAELCPQARNMRDMVKDLSDENIVHG